MSSEREAGVLRRAFLEAPSPTQQAQDHNDHNDDQQNIQNSLHAHSVSTRAHARIEAGGEGWFLLHGVETETGGVGAWDGAGMERFCVTEPLLFCVTTCGSVTGYFVSQYSGVSGAVSPGQKVHSVAHYVSGNEASLCHNMFLETYLIYAASLCHNMFLETGPVHRVSLR